MKHAYIMAAFSASIFSISLANAATVTIDIDNIPEQLVTSTSNVSLNSFTSLTTNGELSIGPSFFSGEPNSGIGGSFSGDAIFTFDTSAVTVTEITLIGRSNNADVAITTFDLNGDLQDEFFTTDYLDANGNPDFSWTLPSTISNPSPVSQFMVELLEGEIYEVTFTYENVTAVPVPAALFLFGSGLIGLATIARRKQG